VNHAQTFYRFPNLPASLRRAIWVYSLPLMPLIELHLDSSGRLHKATPTPAALHACRESRSEALTVFFLRPIVFYGDLFSIDVYANSECSLRMTSSSRAGSWSDVACARNGKEMKWGTPSEQRQSFCSWAEARIWLSLILTSHDEVPYSLVGVPITG
jgi:hypothetical protein